MSKDKTDPANNSTVIVLEGDTWESLSESYYGSTGYAEMLAKYNGLSKFRLPVPGSQLIFPPVVKDD